MITVRLTDDLKAMTDAIGDIGKRHIPRSIAIALTKTAQIAKGELQQNMRTQLDRPTPFTTNSLWTKAATVADPVAEVMVKDWAAKGTPANKYLRPQFGGGNRAQKRFERALQYAGILPSGWYAVPGSAIALDQYGNVPGRLYTQILSAIKASTDPMQNRTTRSTKRSRGRRAEYFVLVRRHGKLKPGIYRRYGFAMGSAVKPMFIFTSKAPSYRQRFTFFETTEAVIKREFPTQFVIAFEGALERFGA